jgi:hypothetical protein
MATSTESTRDSNTRAVRAVLDVLPRSADVRSAARGTGADLIIGGQPLDIEWVGEGSLRDVRRLLNMRGGRPEVVVVGRRLSPGARELLSSGGIGWVDETGAAEIALGSIVVSRTGTHEEQVEKPRRWTPSVIAVAEALLCGTPGTVEAAAEATGLSTGSCTNALRFLTDLGVLESGTARGPGSARHVTDSDRLLDEYAAAADAARSSLSLIVGINSRDIIGDLVDTGTSWDDAGVAWASTGAAAASAIGPYLTAVNASEVYVAADTIAGLEAVAAQGGLRPIEGGRLTLRPFPTVAVRRLAEVLGGLRVAPWPRVYVDLRTLGVRGEEAAEHLREVVHDRGAGA